jgi:hypothetical protein
MVSRFDATVDLGFADGHEGLAVLSGIAALDVPRCKTGVIGRPPETVYFLGSRGRVLGRVYDGGHHAGTHRRGELVRLEDQRRYSGKARPTVDLLNAEYVAKQFKARFKTLWHATKGVIVAAIPDIAIELAERVRQREMTVRQAERLAGCLLLETGGDSLYSKRTRYRRRRELREHGLVLAPDLFEPVRIELQPVVEAVLEAWAPADRSAGTEMAQMATGETQTPEVDQTWAKQQPSPEFY